MPNKQKTIPPKVVYAIIRNRRNASLAYGIVWLIVLAMLTYGMHYVKARPSVIHEMLKFGVILFFAVFGSLYIINAYYLYTKSSSYRIWNKIIYVYLVWPVIVAFKIQAIVNVLPGSDALPSIPSSAASYVHEGMSTAKLVDEYYKQNSKRR